MAQSLTKLALKCLRNSGLEEGKWLVKNGWYVIEMGKNHITWTTAKGGKYMQLFIK